MKLSLIALVLVSSTAFAAKSYDVKMNVAVKGEKFVAPEIIVKDGERTTMFQPAGKEERFIEVDAEQASVMGRDGVRMKMVVGKIDELGERTILARPEVLVEENKPAKVEIDGTVISVLAKEKIQK